MILSLVLVFLLFFTLLYPSARAAEYSLMEPFDLLIYSGKTDGTVARAYNSNYDGNTYLSLTDVSSALNGTSRQFSFRFANTTTEGEHFLIQTGESYLLPEKPVNADRSEPVWLEYKRNRILLNGADRKYYTYRDGINDLYMSLTDIQLMLDISMEYTPEGFLILYPNRPFTPDISGLTEAGYFNYVNGVILGDANTGKILFFRDKNKITSIASTSKLMTYLLLAEAEKDGRFSRNDTVVISEVAEKLSKSADGIIPMTAGDEIPASELLDGMLLASSNESALALAEHVSGSEASFVREMNERAQQLGLNSAEFFNPHGLPVYSRSTVQTKLQNRMCAEDLFRLAAYVIAEYPSITEITSKQYVTLPTLEYTTANSNPLVFNMPGVTGLKTGSTNRAGYCLTASMPVTVNGETHTILLVILGSETGSERGQQAEILLRYAQQYYQGNGF